MKQRAPQPGDDGSKSSFPMGAPAPRLGPQNEAHGMSATTLQQQCPQPTLSAGLLGFPPPPSAAPRSMMGRASFPFPGQRMAVENAACLGNGQQRGFGGGPGPGMGRLGGVLGLPPCVGAGGGILNRVGSLCGAGDPQVGGYHSSRSTACPGTDSRMGSLYGVSGGGGTPPGSMCDVGGRVTAPGSFYGMGSLYGMRGGGGGGTSLGSIHSVRNNAAAAQGSLFGLGSLYGMTSMGGGYERGSFHGILYGGSLLSRTGSFCSMGGSLYGRADSEALMGGMYGSRTGSTAFGLDADDEMGVPHTRLGVVRKYTAPGFSYTFGSHFGSEYRAVERHDSFNDDAAALPRSDSERSQPGPPSQDLGSNKKQAEGKPAAEAENSNALIATSHNSEAPIADTANTMSEEESSASPNVAAATEAASQEEVTKPQLILKKETIVTEAPKSPAPADRQHQVAGSPATDLSSDFRIHNIVLVEQAPCNGFPAVTAKKEKDICVVGGTPYPMDEVLEYDVAKKKLTAESQYMQALVEHAVAGHNTAILVSDDRTAVGTAEAVLKETVAKLLSELRSPSHNAYVGVSMTMCGVRADQIVRDLMVDNASLIPMRLGISPLFGPVVMDLRMESVHTGEDFARLYDAAAKRGDGEAMMVCALVVKQAHPGPTEGERNVFLSSIFIAVSRNGPQAFLSIIDKAPTSNYELFSYAVDGPSVATHLVAVSHSMTSAKVLEDATTIGAVTNAAPRSGNLRRFISSAEPQYHRMVERRDAVDRAKRSQYERHVLQLGVVLSDAKSLLEDPEKAEPLAYPTKEPELASDAATATTPVIPRTSAADDATTKASAEVDGKPRGAKVLTVVIADASALQEYKVKDRTVTANGNTFRVDEVVPRDSAQPGAVESAMAAEVVEDFLKGYNGALVALDNAVTTTEASALPAVRLVATAVTRALGHPACKGVRVSFALVRKNAMVCDLTSGAADFTSMEVNSSPLFGPVLQNAKLHPIASLEALQTMMSSAVAQATHLWDESCAMHVTVVHCFVEKDDVIVSSLLLSLAPVNSQLHEHVLQEPGHGLHNLFRYAFGGVATTAFLLFLGRDHLTGDVVKALSTQHAASLVRNRPSRRGSIAAFISYTKASLEKRRARLATLGEGAPEKATLLRMIAPMQRMLADHAEVMQSPAKHFPPSYATEGGSKETRDIAASNGLPRSASATRASAALSTEPHKRVTQTPNNATTPTAAAAAGDTIGYRDGKTGSLSSFTGPRVVAFVVRDIATDERQLVVDSEVFAVDEMVSRVKRGVGVFTGSSATLQEIESRYSEMHNCSLISASCASTDTPVTEEPVWISFQQILNSAFASGKPCEKIRVDVTFGIISAEELVADLLEGYHATGTPSTPAVAMPRPLEIATSPMCGPQLHNTTSATIHNAEGLQKVMEKVYHHAERHTAALRSGDWMMVGTAWMRRKSHDDDVLVASLTGALTGPSVKAYAEVLERAPVPRRALLSSAYGGPSATVTVLNLVTEDASVRHTVSTAVALSKRQRNLDSYPGSVLAFVKYTEQAIQHETSRASALSSAGVALDEVKDRHLLKAQRLQPVLEDHKALLRDFEARIPNYLTTRHTTPGCRRNGSRSPPQPNAAGAFGESFSTPNTPKDSTKLPSPTPMPGPPPPTSDSHPSWTPTSAALAGMSTPASLEDPTATAPAVPNRVQTMALVTPNVAASSSAPAITVSKVDATHISVCINGKPRTLTCDEVVQRSSQLSFFLTEKIRSVAQQFANGCNAALLCCDLAGSSAGATACVVTLRAAMTAKPPESELYVSLHLLNEAGAAKDMLTAGLSEYRPLVLSNSPIFGPWVHQATVQRLDDVDAFDRTFAAAAAESAKGEGTVCLVNLALKQLDKGDVILSSLLLSLCSHPKAYREVVHAAAKENRRQYQYALQGRCFTVGFLGLPGQLPQQAEQEVLESLRLFEKLGTIENRPLRSGSVRRFINFSTNAVADAASRIGCLTDEHQRTVLGERRRALETMMNDARGLLESPEGQVPKTYT